MDYSDGSTQVGFRTFHVIVPAGKRVSVDCHFSTIQNVAADGDLVLYIEGNAIPFGKGLGYSNTYVPGKGMPFHRSFELGNLGALQVECDVVAGVGVINDSRVNFVAGASSLDVKIAEDKQRKSLLPLNVGSTGEVTIAAGGNAALVAADNWRGEITVQNVGVGPVRLRHDGGAGAGLILASMQSLTLRAAHGLHVFNMSADFAAYVAFLSSGETVIA